MNVPAGAWYIACRSRELRSKPVAVLVAGLPLVLFRDRHGQASALEDRCAHRGAPLSRGRVCAGRIECPYHGWQYDGDGRVAHIPALPADSAPPDTGVVRAWRAVERQGFVWIAVGGEPLVATPHRFAHYDEPDYTSFVMCTEFRASVEACLENFLDCPHATFVHRRWFRAPTARAVRAVVRTLADGAEAEFFDEPRAGSVVWATLAPRKGPMRHIDRFIAPNISQVDYMFPNGWSYTITSCCVPRSDRETRVYTVISFRYGRIGALVRLFFEPLSRYIIRQDVRMLAMQQHNIERFRPARYTSSAADLLGHHIRAWRQALQGHGSPPAAGEERHVEMRL